MGLKSAIGDYFRIENQLARDMLAEFYGTFILVTFAIGASMQYVLTPLASFLTLNFANGMGLVFGIYAAGGISGASLNPAATIALCLHGLIDWYKWPFYTIAEMAGAFLAAAVQYGINYDMINAYDGGNRTTVGPTATAGLFATYPNPDASTLTCFFDQVFATFILMACTFAIVDKRNFMPIDKGLLPLSLGSIVFAIGTCWAGNCGYPLNPARDLAPRIFTAVAGWGIEPFSHRNYNYFWVPIIGPCCGAILAHYAYTIFIKLHWEPVEDSEGQAVSVDVNGNDGTEKQGVNNPAFIGSEEILTKKDLEMSTIATKM